MDLIELVADPWPWWFAGAMVGLFLPFFYYLANSPLGVSTGYGNFCKMVVPQTKLEALNTKAYKDIFTWRVFFIIGIILGGAMTKFISGDYSVITQFDKFNSTVTASIPLSGLWFFCGGILLGLGSRIGHGCTSAHTINGIPNFASSGFVASFSFIAGAVLIVNIIYRLVFPGV
jgi:uncharacterized membrane protein YedE/YeeE